MGTVVSSLNFIRLHYLFLVEPDGSETMIGVLQVNCFDWEDVCAKENIKLYPTVRFYRYVLYIIQYLLNFCVSGDVVCLHYIRDYFKWQW